MCAVGQGNTTNKGMCAESKNCPSCAELSTPWLAVLWIHQLLKLWNQLIPEWELRWLIFYTPIFLFKAFISSMHCKRINTCYRSCSVYCPPELHFLEKLRLFKWNPGHMQTSHQRGSIQALSTCCSKWEQDFRMHPHTFEHIYFCCTTKGTTWLKLPHIQL